MLRNINNIITILFSLLQFSGFYTFLINLLFGGVDTIIQHSTDLRLVRMFDCFKVMFLDILDFIIDLIHPCTCECHKEIVCNDDKCCFSCHGQPDCTTTEQTTTTTVKDQEVNTLKIDLDTSFRQVLQKTHGVFVINVYKEDGPCKAFNVAKISKNAAPNINQFLKIDKEGDTINLRWEGDSIDIKVSSSKIQGEYTVSWI